MCSMLHVDFVNHQILIIFGNHWFQYIASDTFPVRMCWGKIGDGERESLVSVMWSGGFFSYAPNTLQNSHSEVRLLKPR
jgi:hypothetical protein